MKSGLLPIKRDSRDFNFHWSFPGTHTQRFGTATLPQVFLVDAGLWQPDQNLPQAFTGIPDVPAIPEGCTDYEQTNLCVDEDKVLYDPMLIEAITHANANGGGDIRASLSAAIKVFGKKAYYIVTPAGVLDWFDAVRTAVWINQDEYRSVSVGSPWYEEWENIYPTSILSMPLNLADNITFHNWGVDGWTTIDGILYLRVKSWQGNVYGDKGFAYISREVFNAVMSQPGCAAFTISDTAPPKVVAMGFVNVFVQWFLTLLSIKNQVLLPTNLPTMETVTPNPDALLDWSLIVGAHHNVRALCDLGGLTYAQKEVLTACVRVESGFDINAEHKNKDNTGAVWSIDWGIVQINSWFHIGAGKDFPSVEYVLANPEACVRWMCQYYLTHGDLGAWSSFTSGDYKQWLGRV
jgi:hypothetical protein